MAADRPRSTSPIATEWPFLGRQEELAIASDTVLRGPGSLVVSGAPGTGKTRFARRLFSEASEAGLAVEWVVATATARELPFGALARLVSVSDVGLLVREPSALLGALVSTLRARQRARMVLFVDDAQLLDPASATLVQHLALLGDSSVIVTVRTGETAPDAVVALWKDNLAREIRLQPLAEHEVDDLVQAALGGPVDRATVRHLWRVTRGNVMFVRELVASLVEAGSLQPAAGVWSWDGSAVPIGGRLVDLVAARIAGLGDDERAALEVIAVGEPLELALVQRLVGPAAVEQLERRGVAATLVEDGTPVVRVAHPLYGETVRAAVPRSRAIDIGRRLAAELGSAATIGPADVVRIAMWRLDAGEPAPPDLLVDAARRAWVAGQPATAERLASGAIGSEVHAEAAYLLGEIYSDQGRYQDAVDVWDTATTDDARLDAVVAGARAQVLAFNLGRFDEALTRLDHDLDRIPEGAARQRLESIGALMRVLLTAPGATGRPAAGDTEPTGPDPVSETMAWIATLPAWLAAGRFDAVLVSADRAADAAALARSDVPMASHWVALLRWFALTLTGRLDEAEAAAVACLEDTLADPRLPNRAYWTQALGLVALVRGQASTAARLTHEAVRVLATRDTITLRQCLWQLAMARALAGDHAGAEEALAEAETQPAGMDLCAIDDHRARGTLHALRGESTAAVTEAIAAADAAEAKGRPIVALLALHDAARFGGARSVAARVAVLAAAIDGQLAATIAGEVAALATDDGDALDAASRRFESMGMLLDAAEAAAAAASIQERAGRPARAYASQQRARELAGRCDSPRTPLLALAGGADPLSRREREVASLAARGLADREIASRLFLSVRTVNAHLRAIYTKLGVAGRAGLADLAEAPERADQAE